jgi:hypothetical protein
MLLSRRRKSPVLHRHHVWQCCYCTDNRTTRQPCCRLSRLRHREYLPNCLCGGQKYARAQAHPQHRRHTCKVASIDDRLGTTDQRECASHDCVIGRKDTARQVRCCKVRHCDCTTGGKRSVVDKVALRTRDIDTNTRCHCSTTVHTTSATRQSVL